MNLHPIPQLVIERLIDADPEAVFDAWLDPTGMSSWMLPGNMRGATVNLEPVVGGTFEIVMHGAEGDRMHSGRYLTIERPKTLSFSWKSPATKFQDTVVTIQLYKAGTKTRIVLTQRGFVDEATRDAHRKGWTAILTLFARFARAGEVRGFPH